MMILAITRMRGRKSFEKFPGTQLTWPPLSARFSEDSPGKPGRLTGVITSLMNYLT